ncbi:helix-turn-helix domain-containing protein [Orrella sp. JC864]|uniref:helix-turn-helix domain-containing protein n=1 Tax=Orrella sp. JC864 TaxID=3120298 RepID=UPI00300BC3F8
MSARLVYSSQCELPVFAMACQPLLSVAFDTDYFPAHERLDVWRACIADVFDIQPHPGTPASAFHACMHGYNLGGMLVGRVRDNGIHYGTSVSSERTDHILVQTFVHGGHHSEADGRPVTVLPGQTCVLDVGRSLRSRRHGAADIINLMLPREALAGLPDLHGLILDPERGRLLADYLQSLLQALPSLGQEDARAVERITRDMVVMCLRPSAENRERVLPQIEAGTLRRAKRLIESRLTCPQLSARLLCQQLGISRSSLYRLFEPEGGVAHYVQGRRLHAVRQLLARPGPRHRLAELAARFGFSDGAHLSRAFRARYGHTPSEWREHACQAAAGAAADSAPQDHLVFRRWLREIRA